MLRRLLACLALLTGLAAIGAPANPALAEAVTGEIGASVLAQQAERSQDCPCNSARRDQQSRTEREPACPPKRTLRIYVPTVQFGADRAYE
jgi:hypothetical protein